MYRRYRLLEVEKPRIPSATARHLVDKFELSSDSARELAVIMPVTDWESRYLLPANAGQGLSSCSGLDEEAFFTIQQTLQLDGATAASKRSPLLLAGPSGSGKTHLIGCLAGDCASQLEVGLLRVHASVLLTSEGETRRLFQHIQQRQQKFILAIDNVEVLLGGGDSSEGNAGGRALSELADCLLSSSRLGVVLATQRPWALMKEQPRLRSLFRRSTVCLSRAPDSEERRKILTGLAKRPDSWRAFQGSLNSADFIGSESTTMSQKIVDYSEGMSPRDLLCVLHQLANYPIKQMVYQRVRLIDNADQLHFQSEDVENAMMECQAPSVSDREWQEYSHWASQLAASEIDESDRGATKVDGLS